MNKVIVRVDSSALKESACEWKFDAIVNRGYREKERYNDTVYGTAVHKYLSRMEESGGQFDEAVKAALKIWRSATSITRSKKAHLTENHLIATCFDYWQYLQTQQSQFQLIQNPQAKCWQCGGIGCDLCNKTGRRQQPVVEVKFSIPWEVSEHYESYIEGTIDRVGKISNGCYCVRDYKTTSTWSVDSFLSGFLSSTQLKLYLWAIRKESELENSPLQQLRGQRIGAAIDGVFLSASKSAEFKSSEVFFYSPAQEKEFEALLEDKMLEIKHLALGDFIPKKTGKITGLCYNLFPCKFHNVCHALDEKVAKFVLQKNFDIRPYEPHKHGEVNK